MATNNCEIYSAIRRPLDAFVQYFLDVKPYHTKLLEVLEVYNFYDTINVSISESVIKDIIFQNKPLCNATGWGVDWDDACGFDAISCCDLFDCIGGYGLIYDNSNLLVTANIITTTTDGTVTVPGNYSYDLKLPIKAILSATQFTVAGDFRTYFDTFNVFLVIPRHIYPINSILVKGFTVVGDISSEVVARKTFTVYGSSGNDAIYDVNTAVYTPSTNLTTINTVQTTSNLSGSGFIQIVSSNKNNGVYQVDGTASFNGVDTIITVNSGTKQFGIINEATHGSVQFRSGLIYPRHITLAGSSSNNDGDYRIMQSVYNYNSNTTTLTVSALIPDISTTGTVNLYGYEFEPGFDAEIECSVPKPSDIHMVLSERLVINIIPVVTATPVVSVTPTATTSGTPLPTPTPTNSPTPSNIVVSGRETIAQSTRDGGIALITHNGNTKTQVAYSSFASLGITDIKNLVNDGKTIVTGSFADEKMYLLQYDGGSGFNITSPSGVTLGINDTKLDTTNHLMHSVGQGVIEAYGYSYDGGGNILVDHFYGNSNTGFPWPSQLHDTIGRAVYILDNGSIVLITSVDIVIATFTYTPGTDASGLYTINVLDTFNITDGITNYKFGYRIPNVSKHGSNYLIEIDCLATASDTTNISRLINYDSVGHTLTDLGTVIGTSDADSVNLSVGGDGTLVFNQTDAGTIIVSTFDGTTITAAQTLAAGMVTGDKIYFSDNSGDNRLYVMASGVKNIFKGVSGTYTNLHPTDDAYHTSLSSNIYAATFLDNFVFPSPTPTPTPTPTP